jgi:CHAT domain-containing protein
VPSAAAPNPPGTPAGHSRLEAELGRTREAFQAGEFARTAALAESAYREALDSRQTDLAARFLINLGGARFALNQFDAALHTYLDAHQLCRRNGDTSTAAILTANIASLYSQMGELEAAAQWLETSSRELTGKDRVAFLPRVQTQLATVRSRQGRPEEALGLFRQSLDAADQAGDTAFVALTWNRIGEEHLRAGRLADAERALLEAFRLRRLNRLALDSSYFRLGQLRLAQGDFASAATLLDRALAPESLPKATAPAWDVYRSRGRVRLAQGRLREALEDLRIAVRLARAWRWAIPQDEATRISSEGLLQEAYSDLVEAGNRLYLRTPDPALVKETLEAAEENRASSLRALLNDTRDRRRQLPPDYWETLHRLQQAEVDAVAQPGNGRPEAVAALRARLVQLEAGIGASQAPIPEGTTARVIAGLDANTAVLSFHAGATASWLWAVDRSGVHLSALPPEKRLKAAIESLLQAIETNSPALQEKSAGLSRMLFGALPRRFRERRQWLLALDSSLFRTPLSALTETYRGRPVYLVERRRTMVIPGLASLLAPHRPEPATHTLVAAGDAIYNTADPRLPRASARTRPGASSALHLLAAPAAGLALPRLVASGAEVDAVVEEWGRGASVRLAGAEVNQARLRQALAGEPSVIHLAAHVLVSSQRPGYGLIALSLDANGRNEVLTPDEIAKWQANGATVVLSGCASAQGAALPGSGLMGLTRAWQVAGARAVVASQWVVPDDSGIFFRVFYRQLKEAPAEGAAGALQRAQREMLERGDWRAAPRYWGAYFVTGTP